MATMLSISMQSRRSPLWRGNPMGVVRRAALAACLGPALSGAATISSASAAAASDGSALQSSARPDAVVRPHGGQAVKLAQAAAQQPASSLPGGASSLNEVYRDWQVSCVQQGAGKRCVMTHQQVQQNGQRVLAIELAVAEGNAIAGTLAMPFGLALDSGVTFQIDDKPALKPLRFRTCVPAGCLIDISLDAPAQGLLRAGSILKAMATVDGGNAAAFSVSLQGFASALDRVRALSR